MGPVRGAISVRSAVLLVPALLVGAADPSFPPVELRNGQFVDSDGRTLHFRGINVAGSSKVAARPRVPSHVRDGFFEHRLMKTPPRSVSEPTPLSTPRTVKRSFAMLPSVAWLSTTSSLPGSTPGCARACGR